jgi:spermidine synthase
MTANDSNLAAGQSASPQFLPVLLLLFVGSGCSALIYEIVWFQLLQFVIGSSAVSLAVLLGTYMGGMCLGSIALPRLISARHHPLRVYALLEIGIGACGILVYFGMPLLDQMYAAGAGSGYVGLVMRGVVCGVCLLPPTLLMGATLPAVSRWLEATPAGVSWLGFFYGGNIAGAVFGCLLAGFYLLRVYDAETATYVAALTNVAVALIGFGLTLLTPQVAGRSVAPAKSVSGSASRPAKTAEAVAVYVAIALSGLCALGAEVVWTRLLSLLLGGTVYTFSIILGMFLVGLGIGSSIGSILARSTSRPLLLLGACQLFLAAATAWAGNVLARSLPYWPIDTSLSFSPWVDFQIDVLRCLWTVLPATILWGASFPLALAAVASRGQDAGRIVGGVYAANTAGAIVGALATSLCLIPWLGTQTTQQVLIGVSAAAALLLFIVPLIRQLMAPAAPGRGWKMLGVPLAGSLAITVGVAVAVLLAWSVPKVPDKLVAWGRQMPTRLDSGEVVFMGEGMNSSVAVTQLGERRNFHVAGKIEASTLPEDMRLQRMMGHLPALIHQQPRHVLVVGCGAGVTAGSFMPYPDLERLVICEIEPLIPAVVADYFAKENYGVVHDPRVEVKIDDARHFVRTTPEKFDVITSDPIHPWVKGAATLYSKEYYELVKKHLNPGGVVAQWVPLYESDYETVKSEIATFFEVFPDGTIWSNLLGVEGYDVVLVGQVEATPIDLDAFERRLERDDHKAVYQSLKDVGFNEPLSLLGAYAGRAADLKPWLQGAEINRDRNLRLQYLAGMGLYYHITSDDIYKSILVYRRFPEDLFTGSEERRQVMRRRLE